MRRAVTFDFGQTLAELDADLLAEKLALRGCRADVRALEAALPVAWATYDRLVRQSETHPWKALMRTLLEGARVQPSELVSSVVDALWDDQPRQNLWRRPIVGMIELVKDLRVAGVPLAVVSNSEGKLQELVDELGWTELLDPVFDSGVLGISKPDPRIFQLAAERLGVPTSQVIHVGDSFAADVLGARGAGCEAIWFVPYQANAAPHAGAAQSVELCLHSTNELRRELSSRLEVVL